MCLHRHCAIEINLLSFIIPKQTVLYCCTGILLLFSFLTKGQSLDKDSLLRVWNDPHAPESIRGKAMYDLVREKYIPNQPDSAFYLSEIFMKEALRKKNIHWQIQALNLQGINYGPKADYARAIELFRRNVELRESVNDSLHMAGGYNKKGYAIRTWGIMSWP